MMRGRIMPPSEEDSQPKRAKLDSEEDSKERVKKAMQEQEKTLVRMVEERRSKVRQIEEQARNFQAQLDEARKKLEEAETQLARAQNRPLPKPSTAGLNVSSSDINFVKVKSEPLGDTPLRNENGNGITPVNKPPLFIPGSGISPVQSTKVGPNVKIVSDPRKTISGVVSLQAPSTSATHSESDISETSSKQHAIRKKVVVKSESGTSPEKKLAKKSQGLERKEHTDLVASIRGSRAPIFMSMLQPNYVASGHKRKLRSLSVNPTTNQICATSALDGIINLWQIEGRGIGLSLLSTVDCLSPGQRRWPEDMTWHPSGDCLFACYSADGKDNQVAIINTSSKKKVSFLEDKPHEKGIVNSIVFMPWYEETLFATGGSDHAVIMWSEKEGGLGWKPKVLHRSLHSSAVMGVAGMLHKQLVLSVGADKRVIGFDTRYGRADFRHQLENKAMGVLTNPADFNLFMVQTGTPGQQLRLFDIRVQRSELHVFGWRQESSESQSALINQTWSPDGLYIASGSADPKIHIFDIRYNSKEPSQSIKAHQKRVFKAAWHHGLPLLISISSDLNIGLHRYSI